MRYEIKRTDIRECVVYLYDGDTYLSRHEIVCDRLGFVDSIPEGWDMSDKFYIGLVDEIENP